MPKTEEVLKVVLESAKTTEENGFKLLGRAIGMRDVVKFIQDNGFELTKPKPIPEPEPVKVTENEDKGN